MNVTLALGTLASGSAITGGLTGLADNFWFQSGDLSWSLDNHTAGQGPILVGLANGDLSAAEIVESINAVPAARSDIINRELARRPVRRVGAFDAVNSGEKLFDGRTERQTIKMFCSVGVELNAYAFNASGSTLTTGSQLRIFGVLYGSWR